MAKRIRINCNKCNARYVISSEHGGRMGRCSQCEERFILPIPCPNQLLEWAKSTTWRRLTRFVNLSGARGHDRHTIDKFVEVFTERRWVEEHAVHRQNSGAGRALSHKEIAWEKSERKLQRRSMLEELIAFSPCEFERLIADIFSSQGMAAHAVGGAVDNGIDVKIWDSSGKLWAIAQCKRYAIGNKVGSSEIRDFAGAYMLSDVEKGFFFTTSSYTRHAKRTARGYPWLKLYDGSTFVKYIEELKYEIDRQPTV